MRVTPGQKLVISKHWHSPEILVSVKDEGIQLDVSLDDFVNALLTEMQHPLKSFTKTRSDQAVRDAVVSILEKLKQASAHAP